MSMKHTDREIKDHEDYDINEFRTVLRRLPLNSVYNKPWDLSP